MNFFVGFIGFTALCGLELVLGASLRKQASSSLGRRSKADTSGTKQTRINTVALHQWGSSATCLTPGGYSDGS